MWSLPQQKQQKLISLRQQKIRAPRGNPKKFIKSKIKDFLAGSTDELVAPPPRPPIVTLMSEDDINGIYSSVKLKVVAEREGVFCPKGLRKNLGCCQNSLGCCKFEDVKRNLKIRFTDRGKLPPQKKLIKYSPPTTSKNKMTMMTSMYCTTLCICDSECWTTVITVKVSLLNTYIEISLARLMTCSIVSKFCFSLSLLPVATTFDSFALRWWRCLLLLLWIETPHYYKLAKLAFALVICGRGAIDVPITATSLSRVAP